jgi:arylsulfatase A-like enzyme
MDRPNFVIIVADQLRADAVGAFGSRIAKTPNIDALAGRGTRFTNTFVQHTVCSPSRASFLTGWYPHVRGHRSLTHLLRPEEPNLLRTLKEAGYHVTHVGERGDTWAPGATEVSCHEYGWSMPPARPFMAPRPDAPDEDDLMARAYYGGLVDEEIDFDEACTRTAEQWLSQPPTGSPWLLYVPMIFPHCPFAVAEPWYSLHDRDAVPPRRPTARSGHEPAFMQHLRDVHRASELADEQWREIAAVYHGMVSRFDAHVGRMLEAVGSRRDETVVVLFSDHGEYLGDYDLIEKWPSGMHDCLARDPLVMAGPGIPEGREVDGMVELLDIVPTVHDLAGIDAGYTHFGRSLLPVMADPAAGHRAYAFTEGGFLVDEIATAVGNAKFPYRLKQDVQRDHPKCVGRVAAIRSREWTYVWRQHEPDELYDRASDPDELHNLAASPDHAEIAARLRDELLGWFATTSDVLPLERHPRLPAVDLPVPGWAADR